MRHVLILTALCATLAACGDEIGDACVQNADCSPEGDRTCDLRSPEGYCTVRGCDIDSCPEESVCVSFYPSSQTNRSCDGDGDCTPDEVCTIAGYCMPRTSEVRYCMKRCSDSGDCRERYECRDEAGMRERGGEPLTTRDNPPKFCASNE